MGGGGHPGAVRLPQPVPAADKVSRRIRRYYQAQCRAFLRYCEKTLLPQAAAEYRAALASSAPLPHFRAELSFRVTYNDGGLWSLYTQAREVTLPGRTLLSRWGDTWDLAAGYPVPLTAFFPAARYHEDWRRALRRRFNPRNFYLTEEGLTFFYPMYAIAPAAEGIPAFTVPYTTPGFRLPGEEEAAQ